MPEDYYMFYDNFFYKVTNMESPRKNNDCYFYYYSTCTKGDNCTFRHEPSALGCETVCSFWKEGKCLNIHCSFRHMELRKNRKMIPCYWEAQPGGCLKPHCPFLHKNSKDQTVDTLASTSLQQTNDDNSKNLGQSSSQTTELDGIGYNESGYSKPVDPLVVNFEEESDNESAPSISPSKSIHLRVKTLEQIRLEKIQAESAAYYSYPEVQETPVISQMDITMENSDDLRERILKRLKKYGTSAIIPSVKDDFEVLSLDEIRKRKKRPLEENSSDDASKSKRQIKIQRRKSDTSVGDFKIKTLAEIRAEKLSKKKKEGKIEGVHTKKSDDMDESACSEVSSTSNMEEMQSECADNILNQSDEVSATCPKRSKSPITQVKSDQKFNLQRPDIEMQVIESSLVIDSETDNEELSAVSNVNKEQKMLNINNKSQLSAEDSGKRTSFDQDSSKLDDILLLDDDTEEASINLNTDDIFNNIDKFLND